MAWRPPSLGRPGFRFQSQRLEGMAHQGYVKSESSRVMDPWQQELLMDADDCNSMGVCGAKFCAMCSWLCATAARFSPMIKKGTTNWKITEHWNRWNFQIQGLELPSDYLVTQRMSRLRLGVSQPAHQDVTRLEALVRALEVRVWPLGVEHRWWALGHHHFSSFQLLNDSWGKAKVLRSSMKITPPSKKHALGL